MTKILLGKVAFTDAGTYAAGTTYDRFDFIVTDDSCYLSVKEENKGHALTDTAWWKCIARGTQATEAAKTALAEANKAIEATRYASLLRVWLTLKRWRLGNRLIWPVEHLMRLWLPLSRLRR